MKPRELLLSKFDAKVVPHLVVKGFKFAPSKLRFSRTVGYARQRIGISLHPRNCQDSCIFWSMWGVAAPSYKQWHRENLGVDPPNDALGGDGDRSVPGWSHSVPSDPELTNQPSLDEAVLEKFLDNVDRAGIPYLDRISTWEGAAERIVEKGWMFGRAADFLLIAGHPERARAVLLAGVEKYEKPGHIDGFNELPGLRMRLQRFFPK